MNRTGEGVIGYKTCLVIIEKIYVEEKNDENVTIK